MKVSWDYYSQYIYIYIYTYIYIYMEKMFQTTNQVSILIILPSGQLHGLLEHLPFIHGFSRHFSALNLQV